MSTHLAEVSKPPIKGNRQGRRGFGFRHEALFYERPDEFLEMALPFIGAAVEVGEPVLVAAGDRNIGLLGRELGSTAAAVRFAAIEEVARNPARLIPFWRDFLEENGGGPVRGLEEPAWPGRTWAELEECKLHDSLLGVAFSADAALFLLSAYDVVALPPRGCRDDGLTDRPAAAPALEFDRGGLGEVRRRVADVAEAAGIDAEAGADLVLAASELAANSVAHGGGGGTLRSWCEDGRLLLEVEDAGLIEEPLVGRLRPAATQEGGRGLWLANQLCDLVQIRSGAAGTVVRLQTTLN